MNIGERQVRGVIALSFIMAVAPFFVLLEKRLFPGTVPPSVRQYPDTVAVEIAGPSSKAGVYFVPSQTGIHEFLNSIQAGKTVLRDFPLQSGMKISLPESEHSDHILIGDMDAAKKLALDMRIDVNRASAEDLMMIRGIGEKTAAKILELRARKGRIQRMEELMEIPGIKEKRLGELKKYLCVGKTYGAANSW